MKFQALLRRAAFAALAVTVTSWAGSSAQAEGPFHIETKWKVGGDGGWDYLSVDPVSKLLYITRGDHVIVIDTQTGKQVHEIGGLHRTHGVVFGNNGLGYISDGGGNQVAVFDRKTFQILKEIPAGKNPDGMAFDPLTNTVWAFNGQSKDASVIDAKTGAVVATIPLPGKPEFPVADGKGSMFVNIEDKNEIVHLDSKSRTALANWPLAPCESPSGLSIDQISRRLFSVCDNKTMAVVNADTGKVVATPAIGDGPDACAFSAKDKYILSSNSDGTLTVVHEDSPDKYTVVQNLATQKGARTLALDPDGKRVYLVAADFGPRPEATAANPHPRPSMLPGTFVVLVASH